MCVLEQGPPIEDDEEDYDEEEQPLSEDIDDDEEEKAGPSAAAGTRVGASPACHTLPCRNQSHKCRALQRCAVQSSCPCPTQSTDVHPNSALWGYIP